MKEIESERECVCLCVCVCVRERENGREREKQPALCKRVSEREAEDREMFCEGERAPTCV